VYISAARELKQKSIRLESGAYGQITPCHMVDIVLDWSVSYPAFTGDEQNEGNILIAVLD
jgi:hypothetical protein